MRNFGAIFRGEVVHCRVRPVHHKLRYRVFSLALDVDRLQEAASKLALFSLNSLNLYSLREGDHGHRDGSSLSKFAWQQVRRSGFDQQVCRIMVVFYPRILGYAFNPLTVYYCVDSCENPVLMIYEVRNTFGEDVTYVVPAGGSQDGIYTHSIGKSFYVSPFNNVDGRYAFHVTRPGPTMTIGVALKTEGQPLLRTHFRACRTELTDLSLLKMLFAYPMMTAKVMVAIHWEALKLWRKGLKLKSRPKPPEPRILFGDKIRQSP